MNPGDGDQDYADMLRENLAEQEERSETLWQMFQGYEEAEKAHEQAMDQLYAMADLSEEDYVTEEKLNTLKQLQEMFSDKQNRFTISSYVDLFFAYLLKNGIKEDGSYTNSQIFDEVLSARAIYNDQTKEESMSQAQAFELGTEVSQEFSKVHTAAYEKRLKNIESGQYIKEFKELKKKES